MIKKIAFECSDFIANTNSSPLIKVMPCNGRFYRKVKVRKKKSKDDFVTFFDKALEHEYKCILRRSILCNGKHAVENNNNEKFYVFPINGFKFLFNPNIEFHRELQSIYNKLAVTLSKEKAEKIFIDMIEFYYINNNNRYKISDAAFMDKEIIIYNVPYYYAIKTSKYNSYIELLNDLKNC